MTITRAIDGECAACDGNGWTLRRAAALGPGLYEMDCEACNATGYLECSNGGLNCPHPQQCICEAAWDAQEAAKSEDQA
jgi:hypothetical protein